MTVAGDVETGFDPQLRDDPRWAVVLRIADSPHLKHSARLCQFLLYVSACAIRGAPEEATEQQIGIRVFGRPPGYNSSEDSIVRTHARLLRQKLDSYFAEEGVAEEIVVEVPKGHYLPTFHTREALARAPVPVRQADEPAIPASSTQSSSRAHRLKPVTWLVCAALVISGLLYWRPWTRPDPQRTAVEEFWHPFLTGEEPLVIFSNALFTGDSTHGLRYAPSEHPGQAEDGPFVYTYTGIGELAAVYNLTRLFDQHHATFVLKRSLLVTWDEAKLRNLIFIGSRAENPSLRVLPETTDFTMVASPDSAGVVNHHPKPGEPPVYSRPEHPLTRDYAILALLPGVQPGKYILIFSGLTTFGTQAAADFVCQPQAASELMKQITGPNSELRPFEAVLETTIGGGVPLETRLVTIRVH